MGVMACDRRGCEKVMCSRLILDSSRYICDDCWEELLEVKTTWDKRMSAADVRRQIESFMKSPVGEYREVDTEEEFNKLTGVEEEPGEL